MSLLSEKVAHLKGLLEGLNMDGKESKVFAAIAELLQSVSEEIDLLARKHEELDDFVDAIDSDLSDVEDILYDDEDEDEDEDDEEDDGTVTYVCPHCGEEIPLDTDLIDLSEDLECPNCGKPLFPDEDGFHPVEDDD